MAILLDKAAEEVMESIERYFKPLDYSNKEEVWYFLYNLALNQSGDGVFNDLLDD